MNTLTSSEFAQALFSPRAIALVGASGNLQKNTARPMRFMRKHGFEGKIYPINRTQSEIMGEPAYADLADLPGPIDHAFIMVASDLVLPLLDSCAQAGAKVITIYSDGFGETGPAGMVRQHALLARAKELGVRVIGPNSIGLANLHSGLILSVNAAFEAESLIPGELSLVSQSGSMMGSLLARAAARGFGFAKSISVGNESDVTVGEVVNALVDDPDTKVSLLFLETIRDAATFGAALERARQFNKPVIAYKLGRSEQGDALAQSHTGAMAGNDVAVDAFLRAHGVMRVRNLETLFELAPLIETCEESGSPDLLPYVDALRTRMGNVGLVICLDSGAGNYDQLWLTTSLRGMAAGVLKVEILTEGIHSGDASGLVPSSFRILRHVLDRLEDSETGRLLPANFHCKIPADRRQQAEATAAILGDVIYKRFPWAHHDCGGSSLVAFPTTTDPVEALIRRTWTPTLSVTGAEGFPALKDAGNVLRPFTAFKLSLRLPPLVDADQAVQELKTLLEDNAPYQAKVTFHAEGTSCGWNAPATQPWFEQALNQASMAHFQAPVGYIGQGGTIPLMSLLSKGFPTAQMMVCGVLGPQSNAHGPNEFLHVPYAKRLTAAVAQVIAQMP